MLSLKREPRFKPRAPRVAATLTSTLLLPDDREVSILIRNISNGGFMGLTNAPLHEGVWLGVDIPGRGIRRAQIRWFSEGMIGGQFETPLELEEMDAT